MQKKHLIHKLSRADYVTITSLFLIINAFWLLWNDFTYVSVAFAFVSMYLDYLDGWLARRYGGSAYGKVLDSLYDILGWVLFPALVINIQSGWQWWSVCLTTLFCISSALRLSRFTVNGYAEETKKRYYEGMPVSYSRYALLIAPVFNALPSLVIITAMIPLMVSSRLFSKSPPFLMQINLLYAALYVILHFMYA